MVILAVRVLDGINDQIVRVDESFGCHGGRATEPECPFIRRSFNKNRSVDHDS